MKQLIEKLLGDPSQREIKRAQDRVDAANRLEDEYKKLSDAKLKAKTLEFKQRLTDGEDLDRLLPEAFAAAREAARRNIGMRHFDVQLVGGVMLHEGRIAEMRTGEGKTLVATLPIYLNALSGKGVHLVTVNDYLAQRDAGWMAKVYHALGMTTGVIIHDQALIFDPEFNNDQHDDERLRHLRPVTRREAYAADITYGTNNEFGFDYLRDNMVSDSQQMVQRDLNFAIVDEVDSILIDEARTPLIISAPADEATDKYYEFARLARGLKAETDYTIDEKLKAVSLTDDGIRALEKALHVDNVYEAGRIDDVHHIEQALKAEALFKRDRDYVVREGEIIIVDEFTGRLMPGRRWSEGLHQAVEAKEGVNIQQESLTLATVSFQNYFRLYQKLAGMTGTAATEREEFGQIYGLDVVVIPTNMPTVRKDNADRIYKSEEGKFRAVAREVAERHAKGQPVLIGTVSIEKNERLGQMLKAAKVPYEILNAKNNEREAGIVAAAGQKGAVTLATNIAGRGTDIVLGDGVSALGGLHVIGTERHESRRIDNQLRGRSGRQGDPGSTQFYVSMEDDLMRIFGSERIAGLMTTLGLDDDTPIENNMVSRSIESAQKKVEGHYFDVRKQLVEYDDVMNRHREAIYSRRRKALNHENLRPEIEGMIRHEVEAIITAHTDTKTGVMDFDPAWEAIANIMPYNSDFKKQVEKAHPSDVVNLVMEHATAVYDAREQEFNAAGMRLIERLTYLRTLDNLWIEHLEAMESLREGIGLRAVGQRDPLVEYKHEGFRMFKNLVAVMEAEIASTIFKVALTPHTHEEPVETALTKAAEKAGTNAGGEAPPKRQPARSAKRVPASSIAGPVADGIPPSSASGLRGGGSPPLAPLADSSAKIGRNDPCPCGSGLKYKKCGLIDAPEHKARVGQTSRA